MVGETLGRGLLVGDLWQRASDDGSWVRGSNSTPYWSRAAARRRQHIEVIRVQERTVRWHRVLMPRRVWNGEGPA